MYVYAVKLTSEYKKHTYTHKHCNKHQSIHANKYLKPVHFSKIVQCEMFLLLLHCIFTWSCNTFFIIFVAPLAAISYRTKYMYIKYILIIHNDTYTNTYDKTDDPLPLKYVQTPLSNTRTHTHVRKLLTIETNNEYIIRNTWR